MTDTVTDLERAEGAADASGAEPDAAGPGTAATDAPRTAGVVGLGLIGGSFARAYRAAGWRVYALDTNEDTFDAACVETVAGELDDSTIPLCDIIVLAAYPAACVEWLAAHADILGACSDPAVGAGPLVIDTAGVKARVCDEAFGIAREHGFAFCGTHPMAGTEHSGFAWSRATLFRGAPMVLVPPPLDDISRLMLLDRTQELLEPCGFGKFSVTDPATHDRVIGFTSQLCHVVSNAYVKSPTAQEHHGFSAGSYKDLTRVAHLNPRMWSELMVANSNNLVFELDTIIGNLEAYRDALAAGDTEELEGLLAEGDRIKRELDDDRDAGKR